MSNPRTKWTQQELFVVFIHKMYEEAELVMPEEFYPEVESRRVANSLRAQGMGIQIEDSND